MTKIFKRIRLRIRLNEIKNKVRIITKTKNKYFDVDKTKYKTMSKNNM